jgi:hypothetical protein
MDGDLQSVKDLQHKASLYASTLQMLAIGATAVLALAAVGLIVPFHQEAAAAAGSQQQYRTELRLDCSLPSGASGTTIFTLLKAGQTIYTTTLSCNQVVFITTPEKPQEWKMSMTIKDANGSVIATKDTSGRGFGNGTVSSSLLAQGSMFAYIKVPVRQ